MLPDVYATSNRIKKQFKFTLLWENLHYTVQYNKPTQIPFLLLDVLYIPKRNCFHSWNIITSGVNEILCPLL